MDKTPGTFHAKPNFGPGATSVVETFTPSPAVTNRKRVAEKLRAMMGQPGDRRLALSIRTGWYTEQRTDELTLTDILEALEEE